MVIRFILKMSGTLPLASTLYADEPSFDLPLADSRKRTFSEYEEEIDEETRVAELEEEILRLTNFIKILDKLSQQKYTNLKVKHKKLIIENENLKKQINKD